MLATSSASPGKLGRPDGVAIETPAPVKITRRPSSHAVITAAGICTPPRSIRSVFQSSLRYASIWANWAPSLRGLVSGADSRLNGDLAHGQPPALSGVMMDVVVDPRGSTTGSGTLGTAGQALVAPTSDCTSSVRSRD